MENLHGGWCFSSISGEMLYYCLRRAGGSGWGEGCRGFFAEAAADKRVKTCVCCLRSLCFSNFLIKIRTLFLRSDFCQTRWHRLVVFTVHWLCYLSYYLFYCVICFLLDTLVFIFVCLFIAVGQIKDQSVLRYTTNTLLHMSFCTCSAIKTHLMIAI